MEAVGTADQDDAGHAGASSCGARGRASLGVYVYACAFVSRRAPSLLRAHTLHDSCRSYQPAPLPTLPTRGRRPPHPQDGTLPEALALWRRNLDKEFEGVEPCPICYAVISLDHSRSLPRLAWCVPLGGLLGSRRV